MPSPFMQGMISLTCVVVTQSPPFLSHIPHSAPYLTRDIFDSSNASLITLLRVETYPPSQHPLQTLPTHFASTAFTAEDLVPRSSDLS